MSARPWRLRSRPSAHDAPRAACGALVGISALAPLAAALLTACGGGGIRAEPAVVELGPGAPVTSCEGAACDGAERAADAAPDLPLSEVVRDANDDAPERQDHQREPVRREDAARASAAGADEALYRLAREHERAARLDEARRVYLSLIHGHPTSRRIPYAHVAFGDLFFAEAATDDAKLALAEQAYDEVLKFPPPANGAFGYAHLQIARTLATRGDAARALAHAKQAIAHGSAHPGSPGAGRIAEGARTVAVDAYAAVGRPATAHAFFRALAGEPSATAEARTVRALGHLGSRYVELQDLSGARQVLADAFARDPGAILCSDASRVARTLDALATTGPPADRQEASRLAVLHAARCASK